MSIEKYIGVLNILNEYGYLEETAKVKSTVMHILTNLERKGYVRRCYYHRCINGKVISSFRWVLTESGKNFLLFAKKLKLKIEENDTITKILSLW